MVRSGSSPGQRSTFLAPLVTVCGVIAAGTVVLAFLTSDDQRWPAVGCGAASVVLVAIAGFVVARRARIREETLLRGLTRQQAELVRLAEEVLPEAVARLQRGESLEEVLGRVTNDADVTPEMRSAHEAVVRAVLEAVDAEEGLREAAHRALSNVARRVQAIVHRQFKELRAMEDRHGENPQVFSDLLTLDHGTALIGRLADSIAILGGSRPVRQWGKPVPLVSVLRGAMSRIQDYQRVELHPVDQIAIVGPTVEPLIHALAELLDNAARYSPPQTQVHLSAIEVQSGIAIEVEDGGLSLSEEAKERADRMLRQAQEGMDLDDLGEAPRLGLSVVGRLAREFDFQVSLRRSAYGGVRAVLIVPQDALTTEEATGRMHGIVASVPPKPAAPTPSVSARGAGSFGAPAPAADSGPAPEYPRTAGGLPQRRRSRSTTPPAPRPGASLTPPTSAPRSDTSQAPRPAAASSGPTGGAGQPEPGLWLGAFHSGLAGDSSSSERTGRGHSSDEHTEKREKL